MNRYEDDPCPFETRGRANRCQTCCASNGLPPCAIAYLSGSTMPASNVISIRRVEAIESRRAA